MKSFFYNKNVVEVVKLFKYLGVIFCSNGNFDHHASYAVEKAKSGVQRIRKALHKYDLEPKTLEKIFVTMVEPVLTYGAQIWCTNEKIMRKVDSVLVSWGKEVLGVSRGTSNAGILFELGWLPTSLRIRKSQIVFFYKTKNNENKDLQNKCIRFFEKKLNSNNWVNQVGKLLSPFSQINSLSILKTKVDQALFTEFLIKLEETMSSQISLSVL